MCPPLYIFASLGLGVLASLVRMTSDFMEGVKMSWRYHFILAFLFSLVCGFVFFFVKKSKQSDRREETEEERLVAISSNSRRLRAEARARAREEAIVRYELERERDRQTHVKRLSNPKRKQRRHLVSDSSTDCEEELCYYESRRSGKRSRARKQVSSNEDFSYSSEDVISHDDIWRQDRHEVRRDRLPEVFNGNKQEFNDWLIHFETVSDWNRWDYEEKGQNLVMSLRGPAQQILRELRPAERADYDIILQMLRRRFDPANKELLHRREFRTRTKKKGESMEEYGFSLSRLVNTAYMDMPANAKEVLVIEQFIAGLPNRENARHVQLSHPNSLGDAITLASKYESFDQVEKSPARPRKQQIFDLVKDISEKISSEN